MNEPADIDEIVRRIRAELQAGGTLPPPADAPEPPETFDEELRRIRGDGTGRAAFGKMAAEMLAPILFAIALAAVLAVFG